MRNIAHFVKRYPLTAAVTAAVWVLSLMPIIPETPLNNVKFIDKWTHIVMYGGLCMVIWFEYLRRHKSVDWLRLAAFGWLAPVLMSGLLELLQEYCTGGRRNGDWLDFAANAAGATLILCAGSLWVWCRAIACKEASGAKNCKSGGRP